jgi:hypothetical protein
VRRRFALPGFVARVPPRAARDRDRLHVARPGTARCCSASAASNQPPALPGQFRIAARCARRLRATPRGSSIPTTSASPHAPARPAPDERRFGRPPRSLREIQRGLERIARLDPTNAWHAFHLGAAKHLQGLPREAEAHWQTLFADFPDMPALTSSGRWRTSSNGWGSAVGGPRVPGGVAPPPSASGSDRGDELRGPSGERAFLFAVNDPHASDAERRREWLARARELAGIGLPDEDLVARAWEVHFKQRGEWALAAESVSCSTARSAIRRTPSRLVRGSRRPSARSRPQSSASGSCWQPAGAGREASEAG